LWEAVKTLCLPLRFSSISRDAQEFIFTFIKRKHHRTFFL